MSLTGKSIRTSGIIISRPVSITFIFIYFVHIAFIVWLISQYKEKQAFILDQQKKIEELEQKVKILDVIEEYQIGFSRDEEVQLAGVIHDESRKFGMDPLLILAVIISESSFKKHQLSDMGAEGLMQIMPSTGRVVASKWGIEWPQKGGLFDPKVNIRVGVAYLFELLLEFKDIKRAIIAYNIGEAVTREYLSYNAMPPERYYDKVKKIYHQLRSRFETK